MTSLKRNFGYLVEGFVMLICAAGGSFLLYNAHDIADDPCNSRFFAVYFMLLFLGLCLVAVAGITATLICAEISEVKQKKQARFEQRLAHQIARALRAVEKQNALVQATRSQLERS